MRLAFTTYSFDQKVAAVEQYLNSSLTKQEVADKFGIASVSSLSKWIIKYQKEGRESLKPGQKGRPAASDKEKEKRAKQKELLAENEKLKCELAYLKRTQEYVSCILEDNKGRELGFKNKAQTLLFQEKELNNWDKTQIVCSLVQEGYSLTVLLGIAGIAKSTYHYNKNAKPKTQTRPELWEFVREIFNRTPNGCGHRQIAMALRKEHGVVIADKTVLKIMHEMDLVCSIRKKKKFKYSSYKGVIGSTFDNVIKRDFSTAFPWEKMGTDVTEFRNSWGKVYFAPIYDFCSKEIVAWSISQSPNMKQQIEMLEMLRQVKPVDSSPILQSDMGWQYQHRDYINRLEEMNIVQSMSRKGNCLDNACTEGLFGHLKDEFYKGQNWDSYEEFKAGLEKYILYWNTQRRQKKLGGLTPAEYRATKMEELRKLKESRAAMRQSEVVGLQAGLIDGREESISSRHHEYAQSEETCLPNMRTNTKAQQNSSTNNNGAEKPAPRRKLRVVKRVA